MRSHVVVGILVALLVGCSGSNESDSNRSDAGSGGTAGNSGAAGAGGGDDTCSVAYERDLACDSRYESMQTEYLAWCARFSSCFHALWFDAYNAEYFPCVNQLACSASDDACGDDALLARYEENAEVKAAVDTCLTLQETCPDMWDDYCRSTAAAKEELLPDFVICLAKPCAEINPCMEQLMAVPECQDTDKPYPPGGS